MQRNKIDCEWLLNDFDIDLWLGALFSRRDANIEGDVISRQFDLFLHNGEKLLPDLHLALMIFELFAIIATDLQPLRAADSAHSASDRDLPSKLSGYVFCFCAYSSAPSDSKQQASRVRIAF